MEAFHATVDYVTKKGHDKTAEIDVLARTPDAARNKAEKEVRSNKLRQVGRIRSVAIHPAHARRQKRGFFARIFGR